MNNNLENNKKIKKYDKKTYGIIFTIVSLILCILSISYHKVHENAFVSYGMAISSSIISLSVYFGMIPYIFKNSTGKQVAEFIENIEDNLKKNKITFEEVRQISRKIETFYKGFKE